MLFRLRHLNTGRLVVTQDVVDHTGESVKTVGLSEHYPLMVSQDQKKRTMELSAEEAEAVQRMEANSVFRLVSTGVDADNRIKSATSVQI